MYHIIYMSQAAPSMTTTDLMAILMQARTRNEQQAITGALVYGSDQFMQVIEGEEATVHALYQRIAQDPRHQNVFKLADKALAERAFTQWSMAFDEVSAAQFQELVGYVSPAQLAQQFAISNAADKLLLDKMLELITP